MIKLATRKTKLRFTVIKSEIGLFPHFVRVLGQEKGTINSPQSEKYVNKKQSLYPITLILRQEKCLLFSAVDMECFCL